MPPQKTILITGCGPDGIGASLAKEFQLRGHRVIASGLTSELLVPLADLGMETLVMDVTSDEAVVDCVERVRQMTRSKSLPLMTAVEQDGSSRDGPAASNMVNGTVVEKLGPEHGYIDMLINNAGVLHILPFADATSADIRRVFDVNVVGAMCVTRAFIPLLVAGASRPSPHGNTTETIIANLCSINSDLRPPFLSLYNASKAALDVFGATVRPELAPLGVRTINLKTGAIQTELFAHSPPSIVPPGSYYEQALGKFLKDREMFAGTSFMGAKDFARSVVAQLCAEFERGDGAIAGWPQRLWAGLSGRGRRLVIWEGKLVTFAWVVRAVRLDGFWDWVFAKGNRLDQVRRPVLGAAGAR